MNYFDCNNRFKNEIKAYNKKWEDSIMQFPIKSISQRMVFKETIRQRGSRR